MRGRESAGCTRLLGRAFIFLVAFALLAAAPAAQPADGRTYPAGVAQGDSFTITGLAHGARQVAVWTFGSNKFTYGTAPVSADGTFSYEFDRAATASFAPGEYVTVIQHPGPLGTFEVKPSPDRTSILLVVPQPGSSVRIAGLQAPQAAYALTAALDSPYIDDTYTTLSFLVDVPSLTIDTIREVPAGTAFRITGTTNLAPGDTLLVSVTSSAFTPTTKGQEGLFSGISGSAKVQPGSGGANTWSFPVDTSTFSPDEYIVLVSGSEVEVSDTASFTLVPVTPSPVPRSLPSTAPMTLTPTLTPFLPTTAAPAQATPPPAPGFGFVPALSGLACFLVLNRLKRSD